MKDDCAFTYSCWVCAFASGNAVRALSSPAWVGEPSISVSEFDGRVKVWSNAACEMTTPPSGDDPVGVHLLFDRTVDRAVQAVPEHCHERDEREPDHQRGRGRGGTGRVAGRVL